MFKLDRADAALAVLAVAGVAVVLTLYASAFPTSLVTLEVTGEQAEQAAEDFVRQQGADLAGFRRAALFTGDTESLVFLQRSLGNDEAGRWARDVVPVWTWEVRWFQPGQTEEWLASVGVDGELVAFRHIIGEADEGADLDEAAARAIAEAFLVQRGLRLDELAPVQASAERRDRRTDHLFVWQVEGRQISWQDGSGDARVSVRVQGDRVGGYGRYLHVPEDFSRDFAGVLGTGTFLAIGSIVITVLLALVALVIAILRYRAGDVNWRLSLTCGLIVGIMFAIYMLTAWPEAQFRYETHMGWGVFLGTAVFGLLLAAVFYVVFVTFPTAAGESLARQEWPDTLRGFDDAFRGRVLTPGFGAAAMRGYGLAAALMGFFTLFYWFAQRYLGAWLPAEGPYSQIFNNTLPFLTPLTISLVAAISEETIYRLFGVSLFKRWTGSTWLALVIPAAIWAFGHSNYPVFPVYIRGIELTLAGAIFGIAFLRYGLLTCIVAHYVIDAVALGMPLVTSGSSAYALSGAIVIGLALLPGLVGLIAGRGRLRHASVQAIRAEG